MKREEEMRSVVPGRALSDAELLTQIKSLRPASLTEVGGILSVKEVAGWYYPDYTPRSASRALRKAILAYPLLERALGLVGWVTRKRSFTPLQLLVLTHYLGRP